MTATDSALQRLLVRAGTPQPPLSAAQIAQLERFLDTLLLWNRRVALVSQKERDTIICKHFIDSLVVATLCHDADSVADLGSGAGFPGLVMAISKPSASVCLIESRARKVSFLGEARRIGDVRNCRVVHGRIEDAGRDAEAGRHTLVVSRALSDLNDFLVLARPLLQAGGRAIAMKGPDFEAELQAVRDMGVPFFVENIVRYQLPDDSPRTLLVFHVKS